ncbi:heme A synthase [Cryobacterium sp. TMT1-3]|uniref:Heme A synthase n=1 Tax=Cryobacterium luteum TaxID=1424661 RepID=A0A1H8D3Q6_9MICO|nr:MULTISPECIES: COX15/CtaA family protein [Cryobacterium]TFB91882.1 heme A synthase [Cryobacterium luteum]TFC31144.1 heme A synthase [Cryobacterium sp. TMT1-3]SEN01809.1 cytochrome c oxidase assembly protein subunit 15 [Cryobacterium luteum]
MRSKTVGAEPVNAIYQWLPSAIDARIRVVAWLSLVTEILIVGTGGAVRLTGSGLGCPTWPTCVAGSLVPTPEMGIHGVIEFANRTMTGLIGIIAIAAVVLLWRLRKERKDLFVLAVILAAGVLAQALVGGVTVLTGLNPFIVGFHFTISLVMVCFATVLVHRVYLAPGPRALVVPAGFAGLAHATSFVVALTVMMGVLTTASGPHSGDAAAGRTGFNAELLEHLHAWPGYATLVLTIVLLVASVRGTLPVRSYVVTLLVVELVQIVVGLLQANLGLPPVLVGLHMVLACVLAAAMTLVILNLKAPVGHPAALPEFAGNGTARN